MSTDATPQHPSRSEELEPVYDVVVCGAGSSGCVVAARLSEDPGVRVLVLEAGGSDEVPEVMDPTRWAENLGGERDWGFRAEPHDGVAGRALSQSMGRVLGGGSSINVAMWARGHRSDWDFVADRAGDPAWGYPAVLDLYRRIEDWHGVTDPGMRGTGGPVRVEQSPPGPMGQATVEAAGRLGIPSFPSWNGHLQEGRSGISALESTVTDGRRRSVYRSYLQPVRHRENLTIVTGALVTRLLVDRGRAVGVELVRDGEARTVRASAQVVLSLGAINTPALLMRSGIGDPDELRPLGIDPVAELPGVGRNLQDHVLSIPSVFACPQPVLPTMTPESGIYLSTRAGTAGPDVQIAQYDGLVNLSDTPVEAPQACWTFVPALVRPVSRGAVRLTGPNPDDPVAIEGPHLREQADVDVLVAAARMCREIADGEPLAPWLSGELAPGRLDDRELGRLIRRSGVPYWHTSCTAALGTGPDAVVDAVLAVHGLEGVRVADASVLPRITSGNTMAPSVVIGERAADILTAALGLHRG